MGIVRLTSCASGLAFLLFAPFVILAAATRQNSAREIDVRPCKAEAQDAAGEKKSAKRKKGSAEQGAGTAANACIEVHWSSLEVQERLQAFVREQRWHVGREESSESLWDFTLELSREELLGYVKTESATQRVHWSGGKAAVLARTTDLGDGYTRVAVSAQFEGYGESEDKFATQRESWAMPSNGRLEATLIGAVQSHFNAGH